MTVQRRSLVPLAAVAWLVGCGGAGGGVAAPDAGTIMPRFFAPGEGPGPDAVFELSGEEPPAGEDDGLGELVRLSLRFAARVGDADLACGEAFAGVGRGGASVELREARLYVHDVMLIREDGFGEPVMLARDGPFHNGEVAMLDFEDGSAACARDGDPALNAIVRVGAAPGVYVGVAFRVGVPQALNHADPTTAEPPLDVTALHWSWMLGYKHLRIDVRTTEGLPFDFHLGSTACEPGNGEPMCGRDNRPLIGLPGLDPVRDTVVLDYAELVADMDLEMDLGGCISGGTPETCAPMMGRLGIDHGSGVADPRLQSVFRLEPRGE